MKLELTLRTNESFKISAWQRVHIAVEVSEAMDYVGLLDKLHDSLQAIRRIMEREEVTNGIRGFFVGEDGKCDISQWYFDPFCVSTSMGEIRRAILELDDEVYSLWEHRDCDNAENSSATIEVSTTYAEDARNLLNKFFTPVWLILDGDYEVPCNADDEDIYDLIFKATDVVDDATRLFGDKDRALAVYMDKEKNDLKYLANVDLTHFFNNVFSRTYSSREEYAISTYEDAYGACPALIACHVNWEEVFWELESDATIAEDGTTIYAYNLS